MSSTAELPLIPSSCGSLGAGEVSEAAAKAGTTVEIPEQKNNEEEQRNPEPQGTSEEAIAKDEIPPSAAPDENGQASNLIKKRSTSAIEAATSDPTPSEAKKPRLSDSTGSTTTPGAPESPSRPLVPALLRRQVEYYFSDANLRRDRFFHPKIASDPERWLAIEHILSCKRIQEMKATQSDILNVLKDSHLETKTDEADKVWIRNPNPLPEFSPEAANKQGQQRSGKSARDSKKKQQAQESKSVPKSVGEIHVLGCFAKVSNVPEEVSWSKIREAILAKLPEQGKTRFLSTVTSEGLCYVFFRKFEKDIESVRELKSVEVNGAELPIELVEDIPTVAKIIDTMLPPVMKKEREKEYVKYRYQLASRPIKLGETRFESVQHLRRCCKELIDATPTGTELKPSPTKIIRALLEYHPRAAAKLRDFKHFTVKERVDLVAEGANAPKSAKSMKCFFVVREDGSEEDFSVLKCIEGLNRNPPIISESETKKD